MSTNGIVVAVVGATGAVGEEMLNVLQERRFPVSEIRPLASERSAGQSIEWQGEDVTVQTLNDASFQGVDLALFSAGASVSKAFAPIAADVGCYVVDNSSAFRMERGVPLVVPEVNPEALNSDSLIIANPNCSTIQEVVALNALHQRFGLRRLVISTYQSASGEGREAMDELRDQTIDLLNFREPKRANFSRRLAFDTIPQIDSFEPNGSTREELKMVFETRKILSTPNLGVCATCVRVPVFVGHAMSINAEFNASIDLDEVKSLLAKAPGVTLRGDDADFPVAADVQGIDDVHVGRLRLDDSVENGLAMWVVADNLRKGAATNAVQIAEALHNAGKLSK